MSRRDGTAAGASRPAAGPANAAPTARTARTGEGRTALPERVEEMGAAVRRLAWPIVLENLFQTFLETLNVALVGRLGAVALAGVGTATQLTWIGQSATSALAVGTTVLIARFVGAGEPGMANHTLKQSVTLGLLAGAVLGLPAILFAEAMVGVFGLEPAATAVGAEYLRVNMGGIGFMLLMFILGAALRGAGDSRTPMVATGLINVVNAVLAVGLVFGLLGMPELGAVGAAWASVASRVVGVGYLLWRLLRRDGRLSLAGGGGWAPDLGLIWRLLRVGLPASGEQLLISFGMLAYSLMVVPLGTAVFAAQRLVFNAFTFSFLPGFGCGLAATTLVGQALGAGRPDLAVAANRSALRLGLLWMGSVGAAFFALPETFLSLFTNEPELIAIATPALRIMALGQPFNAMAVVLAGSLRGGGDTRVPMLAVLAGMWLVRLPLGYLVGIVLGFGLPGVFTSNILDSGARALVNWVRFRGGRWQRLRV